MMKMCVLQKEEMIFPKIVTKNQGNIAPIPAPVKSELVQNLISRFKTYDQYMYKHVHCTTNDIHDMYYNDNCSILLVNVFVFYAIKFSVNSI